MIHLIKYELKYENNGILKILFFSIAILTYIQLAYNKMDINYLCLLLFFYHTAQLFSVLSYENRSRYLKPLPISIFKLAEQRIFVNLIVFVIIFLLGSTAHLFLDIQTTKWASSIGELFMFGELALLLVFSLMIFADIYTYFKKKNTQIIYLVMLLFPSPLLLVWLLVQVSKTYTRPIGYGENFNIYLFIIDAILIAISVFTFINRKSYLKF